ncbi:hypothetical protein M404DRAFT_1001077 [Pisolithus tinctorius Marx 270]|uniref:Uncharacterized protein n=1 Tax=Pisolithus tinctorius Marx 270 TaxID=870435 RepID=A0A0C3P8A1_PISTI|nr:hypothetical protein M404DRAFT_1001077 [Pisolithus tinctorius Marx 270]
MNSTNNSSYNDSASNALPSWAIILIVIGAFTVLVSAIWVILRATLLLGRSSLPSYADIEMFEYSWSRQVIQPPPPAYSPCPVPPPYSVPKAAQLRTTQASLAGSIASSSLYNS